jgi:phosphoribosylformimino-5-aminoimidazole carboxamide ribotide isomerase
MEIICAVDLLEGGAVRLVQGDYDRRIPAGADAPALARRFVDAGCRRLHVVDLAGARAGRPVQLELLGSIVASARKTASGVVVESGGGIRTAADVDAVLGLADEVVLGTAAIEDPGFLRTASARHPGRVIASLDLRDGRVALDGWSRVGGDEADDVARRLLDDGASRLVVTDTRRDGTLSGPNLDLLRRLRGAFPDAILVAAGGIGSIDDLRALDHLRIDGAIVGMALLTGAVDPGEALRALA